MLRTFFIILALVLLGGVGYFVYDNWLKDSDLTAWRFVPENAHFIYENDDLISTLDLLDERDSWKALSLIQGFKTPDQTLKYLDSLLNSEGKSRELLSKVPITISGHLTSQNSFDLLYIFSVNDLGLHAAINSAITSYTAVGYNKKVRKYLDFSITELNYRGEIVFTFIFYKNYFIGSRTAYLVEDAIRVLADESNPGFAESNAELFELVKINNDEGNLYVNLNRFDDFLRAFNKNIGSIDFGKSAFFDIEAMDQAIQLVGFTYPDNNGLLKQMQNVEGSLFDLSDIISNDVAVLHHFSFRNPGTFRDNLAENISAEVRATKQILIQDYDFDPDYTFDLVDDEMALAVRYERGKTFKTLFLKVKNPEDAGSFFQSVAERYERSNSQTLQVENYAGFEIIRLATSEYPSTVLGDLALGFPECYFAEFRNFLLFSNTLQGLKKNLDDITNENTWRKSLIKMDFLEKTNPEANYSLFINTPNAWNHLMTVVDPSWRNFLVENDFIFKQFDNVSLQFNQVDSRFFTNITIDIPQAQELGDKSPNEVNSIAVSEPIITKPYVVRKSGTNDYHVMIQDSSMRLYSIDPNFHVTWDLLLEEPVIGRVQNIDYYGNGGNQLLFLTSSEIHLLEEDGQYIAGFPVSLQDANSWMYLDVIDYDGSKRYRFSVADSAGQVFLTDKNGKALEGWNPRYHDGVLTQALTHFRVGNRDVMLAQLHNGEIHMTNRRGVYFPGFPLKLREELQGAYHFQIGNDFGTSRLTTITRTGELIALDLKANIRNREQLFKPTAETEFQLVRAVSGKSFVILRKYGNQYDILDETGELLFSKDYLQEEDFFLQFYDLTPSRQYIVVGNQQDEFIYIYDRDGNLITSRPIKGSNPVSMIYSGSKDEHRIYLTNQNELALIQLN